MKLLVINQVKVQRMTKNFAITFLISSYQLFTQSELNDLVRDLDLPKEATELLGSRLNEKNLLAPRTKFSFFRNREKDLVQFLKMEESFVVCDDVNGLLNIMDVNIS